MASADPLVVLAGRLLDPAAGEVLTDRAVVIRGERVEAVIPAAQAPSVARVVDLSDRTVLPGLIDCHAHLIGELDRGRGYGHLVRRTSAQEALTGVANARDTLRAGFTTVRDVGTFHAFVDIALRDAIEDGTIPGPRMMCAGAYVTCPGGGGDVTGLPAGVDVPPELRVGVSSNADEVRVNVGRILDRGADFIKVIATGAVHVGYRSGRAGVHGGGDPCGRRGGRRPRRPRRRARARRGGREARPPRRRSFDRTRQPDRRRGDRAHGRARRVPRGRHVRRRLDDPGGPASRVLGGDAPQGRDDERRQRENFAKAVKAGVRIAFGTDPGIYPHGMNAKNLAFHVRFGQTPIEAICSATVISAELMGWDDRVGSLRPGRFADLIAVHGDPLDDVTTLEDVPFVMKGGEVVKG